VSVPSVDYVYSQIVRVRESGLADKWLTPHDLCQALPNHTYLLPGGRVSAFSDVAVVGRVMGAMKGPAFAHAGDDVLIPVDFDDPSAAEHAVDVQVAVEEVLGGMQLGPDMTFRMGSLGAEDRDRFIDGLRNLGRIVVTLQSRQDRDGEVLIPTEQGALIGLVDDSGHLRFPGLGGDEATFVGGISTLDAYRAAGSKPVTVDVINPDQ
jgi:hypothetical protein